MARRDRGRRRRSCRWPPTSPGTTTSGTTAPATPTGWPGTAIPLAARFVAVADVYDALRCRRLYKPALSHAAAVQIMTQDSPGQFDPDVLAVFQQVAGTIRGDLQGRAGVTAVTGNHMKFGVCSRDISSAWSAVKPGLHQPLQPVLVHLGHQLADLPRPLAEPGRVEAAGGQDGQRLLHPRAHLGYRGHHRRPLLDGQAQFLVVGRVLAQVVADVGHAELDVPGLVDAGPPADLGRHRVRGVVLDEPQQVEERPLAQHRQQERGDREVVLVEERLEAELGATRPTYWSPPPLASARLVNASMCRASSAICVHRKKTTSANCGLIRGTNLAGTYRAEYSFSARNVISWQTARSSGSGSGFRSAHGMSREASHWLAVACSYRSATSPAQTAARSLMVKSKVGEPGSTTAPRGEPGRRRWRAPAPRRRGRPASRGCGTRRRAAAGTRTPQSGFAAAVGGSRRPCGSSRSDPSAAEVACAT